MSGADSSNWIFGQYDYCDLLGPFNADKNYPQGSHIPYAEFDGSMLEPDSDHFLNEFQENSIPGPVLHKSIEIESEKSLSDFSPADHAHQHESHEMSTDNISPIPGSISEG